MPTMLPPCVISKLCWWDLPIFKSLRMAFFLTTPFRGGNYSLVSRKKGVGVVKRILFFGLLYFVLCRRVEVGLKRVSGNQLRR